MRILIATGIFKPEPGGPASYVENLAAELVNVGNDIKVITYSDKINYNFDKEYNFPVVRIVRSNKLLNYIKYFFIILKNLKNYDLVYSLDYISVGLPVYLATRIIKKKYIVRVGGDFIWEKYINSGSQAVTLQSFYQRKLFVKFKNLFSISQKVLQSADKIVFNTLELKKLFKIYYILDDAKIVTIYNPLPNFSFDLVRNNINKEIVYFGRFIKVKNITSLIKAFAKINDKDFRLLLIGAGPEEENLKNLVKELNLANKVEFSHTLSSQDLWQKVINCYYAILPSWTDISPNQVYECLQLGVPVLLTQENYLPINTSEWLKIDPSSVDDLVKKMNTLLISDNYNVFVNNQKQFEFNNSWSDVVNKHLELCSKI